MTRRAFKNFSEPVRTLETLTGMEIRFTKA